MLKHRSLSLAVATVDTVRKLLLNCHVSAERSFLGLDVSQLNRQSPKLAC